MVKAWLLCQYPPSLYWLVPGEESCCIQGNPCCHIIWSAVIFTACLTLIVLGFAKEQLHRCDYSVFVPISCLSVGDFSYKQEFWVVWFLKIDPPVCEWGCRVVIGNTVAAKRVIRAVTWITHSLLLTHFCAQCTEIGEDSVKK